MPILEARAFEFFSRSPEQTRRLGIRLGSLLRCGDVICLSGDLGSGKTTLAQGISQGWGSLINATSPTFVLINLYRRPDRQPLFHLDAYRLNSAQEAEDLDIETLLNEGPLVVEWPERIASALPAERLWINLRWIADEQRGMTFVCKGARYTQLLADFRKRILGG